jgi:DNA-directed RNA polymerase specialized sigma24 family protein
MTSTDPANPRHRFDEAIVALFKSQNPNGYVTYAFIQRSLRQFHLEGSCSVDEIISEVYVRGVRLIASGKTIEKPLAWLKVTSLNVIRELSRSRCNQQQKHQPLDSDFTEHKIFKQQPNDDVNCDEAIALKLAAIQASFTQLSTKDQAILLLRLQENLSGKEVGEQLAAAGLGVHNEVTLRKQGSRALKRLRKAYGCTINTSEN